MGGAVSRHYMCCSLRDKCGGRDGFPSEHPPHFECQAVELQLDRAVKVAFAPLHQRETTSRRRLAVANLTEVNVHSLPDGELVSGEAPSMVLTHTLKLDPGYIVSALLFSDEDNSRHIVVAFGPEVPGEGKENHVRVWNCEDEVPRTARQVTELNQSEGAIAGFSEHRALVTKMSTNRTYLLTADTVGECRIWQKNRAFARRGVGLLHSGGVSDLAADRLFCYSSGSEDRRISVWALPDLGPVLTIPVDIPPEMLAGIMPLVEPEAVPCNAEAHLVKAAQATGGNANQLARVNLLRRPLSRWAGWQGSSRGPKVPRGCLFAAAVLGGGSEVAGSGAGVLMEWSLGEKQPICQSVQIAHDSPIASLVYGPYDNGPLISADTKGIFRVWENLLEKGLCFTQQIELASFANGDPPQFLGLSVAVEQPKGLYVTTGSNWLYVWQRHHDASGTCLSARASSRL